MPFSMTGYGGAKLGNISVEFKTVNHRYFEFSARVPRDCLWAEEKLRALAQSRLSRGKTDCFLRIDSQGISAPKVRADEALAAEYLRALAALVDANSRYDSAAGETKSNKLYGVSAQSFMRMPGVITLEPPDTSAAELWEAIGPVAENALDELITMRAREGERLCADISAHLELLENALGDIAKLAPDTVQAYRERLETRMREVLENYGIDDARILTETAVFAEKTAVDEEISRLSGHIAQMRQYLAAHGAAGRKLDFLTQEMNREANTIGSKALDSAVTGRVLEMKSEIEKIREQVQNIE